MRRAGWLRAGFALAPPGESSNVIAGLAVMGGPREVGLITTAYVLVLAVLGPVLAKFSDGIGAAVLPSRP